VKVTRGVKVTRILTRRPRDPKVVLVTGRGRRFKVLMLFHSCHLPVTAMR
jgi:hypothetical protein